MKVKELKEMLEEFDENKEIILFSERYIERSHLINHYSAEEMDIITVDENGDCVQLFMQYLK